MMPKSASSAATAAPAMAPGERAANEAFRWHLARFSGRAKARVRLRAQTAADEMMTLVSLMMAGSVLLMAVVVRVVT
eukprot:946298-Pyramimonas_sp.AAC.1